MIHIDGSQGEGGGQIVRSSLALSMVTGRPVLIDRVRAGRMKPGLMRQHLTALRAAQQICRARVTGDYIGSSMLTFQPGPVIPGDYQFAVGTSGSATLVLQTVLPPLLITDRPSRLVLEGGTHNPWAPPFDYLERAFLPLVNRMGPKVTTRLEKHGFYPAGGGRFVVEIQPAQNLDGFNLVDRGEVKARRGRVLSCNLPRHIAERELEELKRLTSWEDESLVHETISALGSGNVVVVELECDHVTEVFIGFGEHGVKAETVVKHAIDEMRRYLAAGVPVGPHLADQLLLPLGLFAWQKADQSDRSPVAFQTMRLTDHSLTHIEVLKTFLGISIEVASDAPNEKVTVTLS